MAAIVNSAKTQLNRGLFALAAGTGARAGELLALRVETDVNLNEQTITIRRSVFEGEENTSKSDTGDAPLRLSNVLEDKLQPVLRKLKLI